MKSNALTQALEQIGKFAEEAGEDAGIVYLLFQNKEDGARLVGTGGNVATLDDLPRLLDHVSLGLTSGALTRGGNDGGE